MAVTTFDVLGLDEVGEGRWSTVVRPDHCTPFGFLYGGTGIAVSCEAAERTTDRPLAWITTQFVGSPGPGDRLDVEVRTVAEGRSSSQTQVTVTVDGRPVISSLAAHNLRPGGDQVDFVEMPDVPAPEECGPFIDTFDTHAGSFFENLERRHAVGRLAHEAIDQPERGPMAVWTRLKSGESGSASTQAFIADLGPLFVAAALGVMPGGTSLDNTQRMIDATPTDWLLLELVPDGYSHSIGHSTVRLWSRDGRLKGLAQQSAILRTSHHT